jgi:hypothetical protein
MELHKKGDKKELKNIIEKIQHSEHSGIKDFQSSSRRSKSVLHMNHIRDAPTKEFNTTNTKI